MAAKIMFTNNQTQRERKERRVKGSGGTREREKEPVSGWGGG